MRIISSLHHRFCGRQTSSFAPGTGLATLSNQTGDSQNPASAGKNFKNEQTKPNSAQGLAQQTNMGA